MNFNAETKQGKLYDALVVRGLALTESKIRKITGHKNPRAAISNLRRVGVVINTNNRIAGNGVRVTEYTAGEPTAELIAAGYRALALGI